MAARSGPRAMAASALVGGIILAVMEGVGVMINRASADQFKPQAPQLPAEIQAVIGKKKEEKKERDAEAEAARPKSLFGF